MEVRGIKLGSEEKFITEYKASKLISPSATGYLIVTNRRVIFTGEGVNLLGKKSLVIRDVKIDLVSGVISYIGPAWKWLRFFPSLLLGILCIILGEELFGIFYLGLLYPLYVIYSMLFGNDVEIRIIASDQQHSSIGVSVDNTGLLHKLLGIGTNDAWVSISAKGPEEDTERMMKELGALIQDVQVLGDLAIEKWSSESLNNNATTNTSHTNNSDTFF
ncbi:hypothetical protein [Shimazuella kribbensis]|uniref:hypothetical protein n=1 Tax=Shimazuella kribbensis TaxID=139808 RepID=UPI0004181740|nr:hypothetical protein [Shimazuella kribbensis]